MARAPLGPRPPAHGWAGNGRGPSGISDNVRACRIRETRQHVPDLLAQAPPSRPRVEDQPTGRYHRVLTGRASPCAATAGVRPLAGDETAVHGRLRLPRTALVPFPSGLSLGPAIVLARPTRFCRSLCSPSLPARHQFCATYSKRPPTRRRSADNISRSNQHHVRTTAPHRCDCPFHGTRRAAYSAPRP